MHLAHILARRVVGSLAPIASLDRALLTLPKTRGRRVGRKLRAVRSANGKLVGFIVSCHGLAQLPSPRPSLFCIHPFLRQVVQLTRRRRPYPGVALSVLRTQRSLVIFTSRGLVTRIIAGLLGGTVRTVNGTPSKGVALGTCYSPRRDVHVRVTGGNPTVPPSTTKRVFMPFFAAGRRKDNVKLDLDGRVVELDNNALALLPCGRGKRTAIFILIFGWGWGYAGISTGCRPMRDTTVDGLTGCLG